MTRPVVHQQNKIFRKNLRKTQTPLEEMFWNDVRNRKLFGIKIRRQVSFENFIVDFYVPEHKIIVELDGDSHFEEEKTQKRDRDLKIFAEKNGYKIVRFTNSEVLNNLEMCLKILAECCGKLKTDDF